MIVFFHFGKFKSMKKVNYKTSGTCSTEIEFTLDDENRIHNLSFTDGCNGNLKAISKLCEGEDAAKIADILEGNTCGYKRTSCADQLSKAIKKALAG